MRYFNQHSPVLGLALGVTTLASAWTGFAAADPVHAMRDGYEYRKGAPELLHEEIELVSTARSTIELQSPNGSKVKLKPGSRVQVYVDTGRPDQRPDLPIAIHLGDGYGNAVDFEAGELTDQAEGLVLEARADHSNATYAFPRFLARDRKGRLGIRIYRKVLPCEGKDCGTLHGELPIIHSDRFSADSSPGCAVASNGYAPYRAEQTTIHSFYEYEVVASPYLLTLEIVTEESDVVARAEKPMIDRQIRLTAKQKCVETSSDRGCANQGHEPYYLGQAAACRAEEGTLNERPYWIWEAFRANPYAQRPLGE